MMLLARLWQWLTGEDYAASIDACVCECGCTFATHRKCGDGKRRCAPHGCWRMCERTTPRH